MLSRYASWIVLVLPFACASEEQPTVAEVVHAVSEEYCTALFSCECGAYEYDDADACSAAMEMELASYLAVGEEAGLTFNRDCFRRDSEAGADPCAPETFEPWDPDDEVCSPCSHFYGAVPVGEACTEYDYFDDCVNGAYCRQGVCFDPCARPGMGESCEDSRQGCAEGLACDPQSKTCVAALAEGDACAELSWACGEGLQCGFLSGVCVVEPTLGEPCPDLACAEGTCIAGVCSSPVKRGGPCRGTPECGYPLYCEIVSDFSGTCQPRKAMGAPCADLDECESFTCIDGVCGPVEPWICGA